MDTHYLYVMGASAGVGKSTVCLGLLAQLLVAGFAPTQLAYIKPITQCVAKQPVALFCEQNQIACVDIGTLVFRKGFSRDFIAGLTASSDTLMEDVLSSIHTIAKNKAVVIIDGVGHPAVGSVVGVSNVDVALALRCKAMFVGNPGIGAALDNTVLCIAYMQSKGLTDIGIIYNNIPQAALANIKYIVSKRLPLLLPDVTLLGFITQAVMEGQSADSITRTFSTDIDRKALYDWLRLIQKPF